MQVAELMATMRDNGCRACAIETSSHALHQQRVAGVKFAAAGFTNLTGDHLDYHGNMDEYAAAKATLFAGLDAEAVAVVNSDEEASARMTRDCSARIVTFGMRGTADYRAEDIAVNANGTHFVLITPDGRAEVSMTMIGRHNIENALCAVAMVGETFGFSVHQLAAGLRDATGAPGRLQPVRLGQPFAVFIDYAHTDDAMDNVLRALRPLTRGDLRILFGCGGDRDRTKRPRMAQTALSYADAVYITSDNPRTENPQSIINEIVAGIPANNRKPVIVDADRHRAIEKVIADAKPNDVVLIAGKGHENYQILGRTKHHFDDVEEATKALRARVGTR
jgi:UDP-N-acetylmuramoyl-L-alanyl-D-glutamate--2,6-diaminopimelate ligase